MGQSFHRAVNNLSVIEAVADCVWDPRVRYHDHRSSPQLIVLTVLRFVLVFSSLLHLGCPSGFSSCPSSFLSSVQGSMPPNCVVSSCYLLSVCLSVIVHPTQNGQTCYEPQSILLPVYAVAMAMCCAKTAVQFVDVIQILILYFLLFGLTWTAYHSSQVLATVHCDVNKEQNHIPVAEWLLLLAIS
jgi:hypothetical protein